MTARPRGLTPLFYIKALDIEAADVTQAP
jgi:hypothetical protein